MKRVGIIQPNYIPWRGYFHFIHEVDVFIFLDDVQYTKQDWRNRNKVRQKNGDRAWLSIPVQASSQSLIKDVTIDYTKNWVNKHLSLIEQNYSRTPFFSDYFPTFETILASEMKYLSDLDIALCERICDWLGIETRLVRSSELNCGGTKDRKLIELVRKVGGTHYLSGPAAKTYIQPDLWQKAGIGLSFMDYPDYPVYPQIAAPFEPSVSVLDLLFMTGPNAPDHIWGRSLQGKEAMRANG